jgi:hypothetical protein
VGIVPPGNGGGFPARRKRARGAPVDERRLGPNVTCCLTNARSNRLLPTRLAWVWEQGASEIGLRALRAVDNAATAKHPSGGALLSTRLARRASNARSKLEARRQTSLHLRRSAAKRSSAWESSGCSSARAEGRLQKSARVIFPAPPLPERAMEVASIARIGPLHVTWSWLASGEKGAERLRGREQQARGSSTRQQCRVVEPMEGALGRTSFVALTGGEESRPWQGRICAARQPSGVLHWMRDPKSP